MSSSLPTRKEAIACGFVFYKGNPCLHKHDGKRYTSSGKCVACSKLVILTRAQKDRINECRRLRYYKNRRKEIAACRAWQAENPGYRKNRNHALENANYIAKKLQRTPAWSNLKQIDRIYRLAKWGSRFTDELLEVDHIIPMRGTKISGLHVPENLQILRQSENRAKSSYWPYVAAE